MSIFREPSEMLEIAIRIEREGIKFYTALSESVLSNAARDLFSFLAAEEEKHLGILRQILDQSADYTPQLSYPGEFGLFIEEFAAMAIRTFQTTDIRDHIKDYAEAIALGLQVEMETMLFYNELRDKFPKEREDTVNNIIEEERSHILELKTLREKLNQRS